jgi:hypothetical protein
MQIALFSDTHSYLDERIFKHLKNVDEIWHAGDIGSLEVTDKLKTFAPLRAVYGNIDNHNIRAEFPEFNFFTVQNCKVLITHIAGGSNFYSKKVMEYVLKNKPMLFICGHSHILKIYFNKSLNCLHINPGAAGKHGFHTIQTFVKFELNNGKIENLQIVELDKTPWVN